MHHEADRLRPSRLFIDTDMGIDGAVALAWLLRQPAAEIVGFSTVFGSNSVQNNTANLLTVFDAARRALPVTIGASEPLMYARPESNILAHGCDGLGGTQRLQDLSVVPKGAPAAIAAAARAHPGLTILCLGPLTNIARAVLDHRADLEGARLLIMGGSHSGGNATPVAEFNAYADPQALAVLLESGLVLDFVPLDVGAQVQIPEGLITHLMKQDDATLGHLIGKVLLRSRRTNGQFLTMGDAVAAIYALRPELGTALDAIVKVVVTGGRSRGQTVIVAHTAQQAERALGSNAITLRAAADHSPLDGDASSARSNARVVTQIDARAMTKLLAASLLTW